MSKLVTDFNNIIRFALGLPEVRHGEFANRTSALLERHFIKNSPIAGDWKLVGFVLDSETTVLVSQDFSTGKSGPTCSTSVMQKVYAGPRELIYRVMEDFRDSSDSWAIDVSFSPARAFDDRYSEYALNGDLFIKPIVEYSKEEIASLGNELNRQLDQ